MPVYTRCSARRGEGQKQRQRAANARQQQQQYSLKRATRSLLSLSLSQRNVDHFCFQYEIIDSAVDSDSGSEETRAHEQVLRPHTTSPLPPHCRKWSAATERVRERHEVTCSLALPQSTLLALLCRLGALFGACLASLNNVISESVWRCMFVCMCVCVSQSLSASQCAALPQLTYFSVVQIQVYVREINFDFVSLRFVFMPMRGLHTHTQTQACACVCCMC